MGRAALARLRAAHAEGRPYALAILDYQMPGMDGLELAKTIAADPALATTRLIMLSSVSQRGHGAAAQRAGIAAVLTKPVRQSNLFNCLLSVMGATGRPALPAPSAEPAQAPLHARVLVVEDNVVNQTVAVRLLEKLGCRVDVAASGLEAVQLLAELTYDVVFMDCQMPEMDGFEATAQIRRREASSGHHVPIIALTANAMQGDSEHCLAAGMDDYVSKPVTFRGAGPCGAEVGCCVGTARASPNRARDPDAPVNHDPVTGARPPSTGRSRALLRWPARTKPARHRGPAPSLRVLVVEDNPVNQLVIRGLLERLHHTVILCGDGPTAIAAVEAARPDLVLMDVQMPEMDGFAATAAIREREAAQPGNRRLPIVALTAFAMPGDRERCLAAGMDDYLTKPVRPEQLEAALARLAGEVPDPPAAPWRRAGARRGRRARVRRGRPAAVGRAARHLPRRGPGPPPGAPQGRGQRGPGGADARGAYAERQPPGAGGHGRYHARGAARGFGARGPDRGRGGHTRPARARAGTGAGRRRGGDVQRAALLEGPRGGRSRRAAAPRRTSSATKPSDGPEQVAHRHVPAPP